MTVDGLSDLDLSYPAVRQPLGRHPACCPGLDQPGQTVAGSLARTQSAGVRRRRPPA
jgi:hypothetical protein